MLMDPESTECATENASAELKTYGVYSTKWHFNLRIHDQHNVPLYFIENSSWTPHKPDVSLHAGSEKTDPVLGVARFEASGDMKVGIGDINANDGLAMIWEDVTKKSRIKHSQYEWSMNLPGRHERRTFVWKRTHHFGLEDEPNSAKSAWTNLKLFDAQTGKVVANFARNGTSWGGKVGKFVIRADYGEEWELMMLLTALAIVEKVRRVIRYTVDPSV
jgi:hypothetical protein